MSSASQTPKPVEAAKHTPGDWIAHPIADLVITRGDGIIADCRGVSDPVERRANVYLVSASRDLLDYARLEHEYANCVDAAEYIIKHRIDVDCKNDDFVLHEAIGSWLSRKRTAALTKAGVAL